MSFRHTRMTVALVTCTSLVGHAECAPSLAMRAGAFTSSPATALAAARGGTGAGARRRVQAVVQRAWYRSSTASRSRSHQSRTGQRAIP